VELRLDRPKAKNAIGKDMLHGLRTAIEEVEADATANVILVASSVPKVFCAGADLKVLLGLHHHLCTASSILSIIRVRSISFSGSYLVTVNLVVSWMRLFGDLIDCVKQGKLSYERHISALLMWFYLKDRAGKMGGCACVAVHLHLVLENKSGEYFEKIIME
jgi:hypothetical protein